MNRQRRRPPLFLLIIFAAIAGVIFLVIDNPTPQAVENSVEVADNTTSNLDDTSTVPNDNSAQESIATPVPELATVDSVPSTFYDPYVPEGAAIFIPSAGIYAPIVETYLDGVSWDVSQLGNNVGHLQGTPWVDSPGNVVLSGHVELSDGRQGIFATLSEVAVGDIIVVTVQGDEWRYMVTDIKSATPDDVSHVYPTDVDVLTLITCDGYDFFQNAYLERTIVVSERL